MGCPSSSRDHQVFFFGTGFGDQTHTMIDPRTGDHLAIDTCADSAFLDHQLRVKLTPLVATGTQHFQIRGIDVDDVVCGNFS